MGAVNAHCLFSASGSPPIKENAWGNLFFYSLNSIVGGIPLTKKSRPNGRPFCE